MNTMFSLKTYSVLKLDRVSNFTLIVEEGIKNIDKKKLFFLSKQFLRKYQFFLHHGFCFTLSIQVKIIECSRPIIISSPLHTVRMTIK